MNEILKRELNKTYLIMESGEDAFEESYELQMIIGNAPQRILPLRVMRMDCKIQLYYDISSKQTLKDLADRQKIKMEMICTLFRSIESVFKEAKEYLLETECLLLDMNHIYVRENVFYFCYCPWIRRDSLDGIRLLLEELLGKLDYHDTKGVELAYHLYQNACKGSVHIEEIINEHCVQAETKEPECNRRGEFFEEHEGREEEQLLCDEEKEEKEDLKKNRGLFRRILQFFLKKQEDEEETERTEVKKRTEYPRWEENMYDEMHIADSAGSYRYETDSEDFEGDTVLLDQMEVKSWRLQPMTGEYPVFHIREENFVVGKKSGAVDGYIERNTISRIHSRLSVRQGRLFIMDANSTNGTYVNGETIEPGREVEIFSGDRILFADVAYECYNSL